LLLVGLFAETHEPGLAHAQRRRAEVAGGAEHVLDQLSAIVLALLQVEDQLLLAASGDDLVRSFEELVEVSLAEALFLGVDRLTDGDGAALEEGVRALAARSALAVVVPVDALAHEFVPWVPGDRGREEVTH
jgi:hypothetical protein